LSGFGKTGDIDEFRISTLVRSADWIKTEYNNQSSPSTFETFGSEGGGSTYTQTPANLFHKVVLSKGFKFVFPKGFKFIFK
jgi:hypothetical protein